MIRIQYFRSAKRPESNTLRPHSVLIPRSQLNPETSVGYPPIPFSEGVRHYELYQGSVF